MPSRKGRDWLRRTVLGGAPVPLGDRLRLRRCASGTAVLKEQVGGGVTKKVGIYGKRLRPITKAALKASTSSLPCRGHPTEVRELG